MEALREARVGVAEVELDGAGIGCGGVGGLDRGGGGRTHVCLMMACGFRSATSAKRFVVGWCFVR